MPVDKVCYLPAAQKKHFLKLISGPSFFGRVCVCV